MPIYKSDESLGDIDSLLVSTFSRSLGTEYQDQPVAIIDAVSGQTISRKELRDKALRFAYGLRNLSKFGKGEDLKRGDMVSVFSINTLDYPVVILGAFAAGVRIALSSPVQTPKELAHQLKLTMPSFFVVHPAVLPVFVDTMKLIGIGMDQYMKRTVLMETDVAKVPQSLRKWTLLSDLMKREQQIVAEKFDGPVASACAMVLYSSGTTSAPKAVELSHLSLNVHAETVRYCRYASPTQRLLTCLPFFHVAGSVEALIVPLILGSPIIFLNAFTPEGYWTSIHKYRVSTIALVPVLMAAMNAQPPAPGADVSSLEHLLIGAAPLSDTILAAFLKNIRPRAHPNFAVRQVYGLTETCSAFCIGVTGRPDKQVSVGRLLAGIQARIVDDDGKDVKQGEPGEVWVKSPAVMNGYFGNPKATKETFSPDGWFMTGDIGRIDDEGFVYVVDRKKELIKYNAVQVPPATIEAILMGHPQVADCGVIGVQTVDGSNELVRAYIAPKDHALLKSPTFAAEVQEWIKDKASKHHHLRGGVVLLESIPRSASGKILRRELREIAKKAGPVPVPPRARL